MPLALKDQILLDCRVPLERIPFSAKFPHREFFEGFPLAWVSQYLPSNKLRGDSVMRWTPRLAILNAFEAESIKDRILYIGKLWWKTIYGAANCEHLYIERIRALNFHCIHIIITNVVNYKEEYRITVSKLFMISNFILNLLYLVSYSMKSIIL